MGQAQKYGMFKPLFNLYKRKTCLFQTLKLNKGRFSLNQFHCFMDQKGSTPKTFFILKSNLYVLSQLNSSGKFLMSFIFFWKEDGMFKIVDVLIAVVFSDTCLNLTSMGSAFALGIDRCSVQVKLLW